MLHQKTTSGEGLTGFAFFSHRSWLVTLSVFAILGLTTATFGQERFGEFNGHVTDPSGAVLPNVAVTITNRETNRVYTAQTGSSGDFVVRNLDPGRYNLRFEAKGFTPYEVADVNLLVGKTLTINAPLAIARAEQSVQVTESAALIDTTNTTVANNISAEEFDRLPKARTFQSLVALSPSVNSGQIENGFQVNGASAAENQFNIDGVSSTSLITGGTRQDAVFEILQEVQVKTGGVDAEYGGALGGVISAITKSGGNKFHGDVHYYFSGSAISAGPVQRLLLNPIDDKTVSYVQDYKNPNKSNEVGYSLGGYLVKNKLFFFSAASPRFLRRDQTYLADAGANKVTIHQEQTFWQMFNKISFEPAARVRGSVFWLWSPTKSTGTLPAYNYFGNAVTNSTLSMAPLPNIGYFNPQSNYGGNLDLMLTNTSILTIRGGRFWDDYKDTGIPGFANVTYQTPVPTAPTATFGQDLINSVPANLRGGTNFYNTPRYINNFHDLATRAYLQLDYGILTHFLGTHDLKVGWGVQKNVNNVDQSYPGGGYVFVYWDRAFRSSVTGATQRGPYGYYEVDDFRTKGTTGANLKNVYIQDKWHIKRLTLSLGFRFESEAIPSFRRDIRDNAFEFGWTDKFAPRLGATYDLLGNGKVKLYGSWGRYFDWVKYSLSRGAFGADYWHVYYRTLDTPDAFSLSNAVPGAAASNGGSLPGKNIWSDVTGSSRDRRVPNFDTVIPGIKPMYSDLINAGAEFQVNPTTVARVGFVRNSLGRTIEDLGVLVNGDEVYYYGNPGEGGALETPSSGATKPFPTPKAERTYTAMEFSITRRFAKRWLGSASYVYSRLQGNYPGLSNTDEVRTPTSGVTYGNAQAAAGTIVRNGDSASRAWDLDEILWDSHGKLNVDGRLPTDRPNVFKLYGSYTFKWGTELAGNFYGGSGTPLSTYGWTINGIPVFVNGRGDLGRTAALTQTDLLVAHEVKLGESRRLRFEANVINLFNQKTSRHRFVDYNRQRNSSEMDLSSIDLAKGYDYKALIAGTTDGKAGNALDPRFNQTDLFNPGFAGRFGVKFIF
jgi:carboxypeptidase family protein/TonB-dependent receptor-like protein